MTRSDLMLEVFHHEPDSLVNSMHKKIEAVYQILFVLEEDRYKELHELAAYIRKALEK
jgi:hypothetical protein